jgi:hypothetical protein
MNGAEDEKDHGKKKVMNFHLHTRSDWAQGLALKKKRIIIIK